MDNYSDLCENAKNFYDPNDNFLLMKMHELEPKFEYKIWNIKSGKSKTGIEWKLATFFYPIENEVIPRKVFLPNGSTGTNSFSFKQLDKSNQRYACLGFSMT